jgi:hypothetical protein
MCMSQLSQYCVGLAHSKVVYNGLIMYAGMMVLAATTAALGRTLCLLQKVCELHSVSDVLHSVKYISTPQMYFLW